MKKMVFSILIALFWMLVFVSNIFAQSDTFVHLSFTPVSSLAVGELLTLPLTITNGENVAGYQATVSYDTSALRHVSSKNGDYLPQGAFFVPPIVAENTVTLAATSLAGVSNGDGTLATLTFEVVAVKASTLTLSNVLLTDNAGGSSRPHVETTQITESGPSSNAIDLALPSDLISEVAFGRNSTYFVFNAKFLTLTGVADTDVSYRVCTITLDLPGVPDNTASDRILPSLLEYLRQIKSGIPIIDIAKGFAEKAGLLDVFPDEPQYFIFSLKTAGERSREIEADADKQFLSGAGSALIGLIPNYGILLNLGITVASVEYNRIMAIDELLKSTMDPRIVLDAWGSDRNFPLRWKNPGRPDNEYRYVLIFPRRITEIGVILEQEYMLKSDQGHLHTERYEGTYNLRNSAFAAPHGREITLSEYSAFQLLPLEVQDYLLRHFPVFASFEALRVPKETSLLPNYPNPFNPETWIPYQLSAPANVTISIYAADGRLVRRLDLGHQPVGLYEFRNRAAYWDGRNALGEPVASGLYFYTLTAGDFTATRKMLIKK